METKLFTAWNEINEALASLTDLAGDDVLEAQPAIIERLLKAQAILHELTPNPSNHEYQSI